MFNFDRVLFIFLVSSLFFTLNLILPEFLEVYAAAADNTNLHVSAQNNEFSGPQVIEVKVSDTNITAIDKPLGEPDVTVNGKDLRMVQSVDGNWYGYFADRLQAQTADATQISGSGKGLDFGAFCHQSTPIGILGASFTDTDGIAIPRRSGVVGVTDGLDPTHACAGSPSGSLENHVVREPKSINLGGGPISVGQIGLDPDAWPIIQLYNFAPGGNVVVKYDKGGEQQIVTLLFDSIPSQQITMKMQGNQIQPGSQIELTIQDPQLNIDPTDEDSWTWSIESGNNTLFYQAFDEDGQNDSNGSAKLVDLIPHLSELMFNQNGKISVDLVGNVTVIESDTNSLQPIPFLSSGLNQFTQLVTFVESTSNSGNFVNYDEGGDSDLDIVSDAKDNDKGRIAYNGNPINLEVDEPIKDGFELLFKSGSRSTGGTITQSDIDNIKGLRHPDEIVHFLLQFNDLIVKDNLSIDTNIRILDYVTGNTFIVSSTVSNLQNLLSINGIRWAGPINIDDKIDHSLKVGNIGSWSKIQDKVVLTIFFHKDVKPEFAEQIIDQLGGQRFATVSSIPSITAAFDLNKINQIAEIDSVQFVDLIMPPLGETTLVTRKASNVEPLNQENSYNLRGNGIKILVYDVGVIDADHPAFRNRLQTESDSMEYWHATFVGGIVGGDGSNSQDKKLAGMAPEVQIISYGLRGDNMTPLTRLFSESGDLEDDIVEAEDIGIDLASMSMVHNIYVNDNTEAESLCPLLGKYSEVAEQIDSLVDNPTRPLLFIEAAGNERAGNLCGTSNNPDFFWSISSPATAKNSIAVGAITARNEMTEVSSFGPTKDGRLKPDITAPACHNNQADGGIISTFINTTGSSENFGYQPFGCATSWSTPVVSGATILLLEEWKKIHSQEENPLPHTVKAILIHTATDLGRPGPDYEYGWGALNAKSAVDFIEEEASGKEDTKKIIIDDISVGQTISIPFESKTGKVKATLVWDDPPGAQIPRKVLKNDLNMRLIAPNNQVVRPLTLDPLNPQNNAEEGDDALNNVEMVKAEKNVGNWKIEINGAGITDGPQKYTLIISEIISSIPPNEEFQITSTPIQNAKVGEQYSYDVEATTPPIGQSLTFSFNLAPPAGMTINSSTGVITWIPNQEGLQNVSVKVTSGASSATQSFDITVARGGCLIATAAYGSEMAPQVQLLRETRDNNVMKTQSGFAFMAYFNSVYYTFAPIVAGWEQNNPDFKELVKFAITPLIYSLSILNHADIDSESEMLTYGIGVILLNIAMYFIAPLFIVLRLKNYFQKKWMKTSS